MASPYLSFENSSIEFESRKNSDRNPRMAKIFDEYKIKGSLGAMAKIAGMESTAKSKSEDSTMIRTNNNFVPYNFSFPLCSIR
jgi:hypothetical protein